MFTTSRIQKMTWVLAIATVVSIVAGYAAVAASTYMRPPTVVVTFTIEQVVADLTERADADVRLSALFNEIQDELDNRKDVIDKLEASIESAAEIDRPLLEEKLMLQKLQARSYGSFASMRVDTEKSLMLRDIYMKIRDAVAEIAQENGYDLVLINDVGREVTVNPKSKFALELQVLERIGVQRVMFASKQLDITDQIVTYMNLNWEKRTGN